MALIDKHIVINADAALNDEIDYLAHSPDISRERLDLTSFDPTNGFACFLGQLMGGDRDSYKKVVGNLPASSTIKYQDGRMTALEVWSANMWDIGKKDEVIAVFNYIKSGGKPQVKFCF